ncbi:hypothetical protein OC834_007778 [Tilletia horrida]|nr:hypothetical protein OC834_007778 [Tilletia horrida]
MVSFRALGLIFLAGLSIAAPLDAGSSPSDLVARQSTTWNDDGKQPYRFAAQSLGNCNYQLTFRRNGFDGRHTLRFYATYPGSSQRADFGRYSIDDTYNSDYEVISLHAFRGICASGTTGNAPTSFFVRATLNDGYTYTNDWISAPFKPTSTPLPAAPTNVRVTRFPNSNKFKVSWTPSAAATGGYYVLFHVSVYAYDLGEGVDQTLTIRAKPNQTSVERSFWSRDELVSVTVSSEAAEDIVSDATKVPVIPAPSS